METCQGGGGSEKTLTCCPCGFLRLLPTQALTHWDRHRPPLGLVDDTPGRPGECPYKAAAVLALAASHACISEGYEAMSQNWKGRGAACS